MSRSRVHVGLVHERCGAAIRRDKAAWFRKLRWPASTPIRGPGYLGVLMTAMFREKPGQVEEMAADLAIAIDGFRTIGDRWGTSMALRGLSSYQGNQGEHEGAWPSLEEALSLIEKLGSTRGSPQLLGRCAVSRIELGDLDGPRADLQPGLAAGRGRPGHAKARRWRTWGWRRSPCGPGRLGGQGLAMLAVLDARPQGRADSAARAGDDAGLSEPGERWPG